MKVGDFIYDSDGILSIIIDIDESDNVFQFFDGYFQFRVSPKDLLERAMEQNIIVLLEV